MIYHYSKIYKPMFKKIIAEFIPEGIETRKRSLGRGENETLIADDKFALRWVEGIDISLPTLISASGVYQYFDEAKINITQK